jgi:hypothetical protein
MKKYPSFRELDALGNGLAKAYLKKSRSKGILSFDIDGFVIRYLGYNIAYETFAEADRNRNGFCADGTTPLRVCCNRKTMSVVFPEKTIVLDRSLLQPSENKRRRFTLAHEAAHPILDIHAGKVPAGNFHTEFDKDEALTPEMMDRLFSMKEACTNRLGAAILMPLFLIDLLLKKYNDGCKLRCYDGGVFSTEDRHKAQQMADCMDVSYTAFVNRLKELNLLDYRPIDEYLSESLKLGETI